MKLKNGHLCRLCLNTICVESSVEITDIIKEIFNVLLLHLNLDTIRERTICKTCSERLQKSFEFKSMCLFTFDQIFPHINKDSASADAEFDLREIYLKTIAKTVIIPKEQQICRLCMKLINDQLVHIVKGAEEMLEKYMPELDSRFKNFVLCASCTDSLKDYACFVGQCLDTERKINACCDVGISQRGPLSLNEVEQFAPLKVEVCCEEAEKVLVKIEIQDENQHLADPDKLFVKCEYVDNIVKTENNIIKTEKVEFVDVQEAEPVKYETRGRKRKAPQNPPRIAFRTEKPTFICDHCGYQNDVRKSFVRHMFLHRNPPPRKFDCPLCEYKAKRKAHLDMHLKNHEKPLVEKKTFKCEYCPYEVRFQCMLKPHMLIHLDPAQINMFSCELCPYKSKFKSGVLSHMRKHRTEKVFQCEKCAFKTNYEESMRRHQVYHLDPALRRKFKCASCDFEADRKCTLYLHIMRAHTDPSAVPMHKCKYCKFKSFYKGEVNQHMLKHKDPSELPTFDCPHCDFKTIFKRAHTRHLYHHKGHTEVKMYKCDKCPYVTHSRRHLLRVHMIKHLDPSETIILQCDQCEFSSKYKSNLRAHIKKHHK